MVDISGWERKFFRSMLAESDGTVSSTRCMIALVVMFSLGWITGLLLKVRKPVTLGEVQSFVGTLTVFVTSICGTLYGINRVTDVVGNRAQKPE
ncbi:hypothetical protein H7849_11840 [Alloacidobacterium dinghuense]|uniref:Uncharacterized protein n=1 Tax=Alloacidobacterium dinghuense TaxID=2763107 RepID=A0A7G8BPP7_9BACT|nr:hypothetical protein [Alloacidobacterium dinghuense]QNI34517.1 hypothetical protein H7849_11840 [Alloacidobacterium dinghuense]